MSSYDNWYSKVFNATSTDVYGLVLNLGAYVYEAPPGVQTVSAVVKSNSKGFIDAFEFKERTIKSSIKALDIGVKNTWGNAFLVWSANYIVDIYVPTAMIEYVDLNGGNDVVISSYNCSIFMQDSDIALKQLQLEVSGSGLVQVDVGNVTLTNLLHVKMSGSGDVAISSNALTTGSIQTDISGSGNIYVAAKTYVNTTKNIATKVSGSGRISGSGSIEAGGITAQTTHVSISGSGNVYARAVESIGTDISGSGSVYVVGTVPPSVSGTIKTISSYPVSRYTLKVLPDHRAFHLFQFGVGLSIVLGLIVLVIAAFLTRKFGCNCLRRCCRRRQREVAASGDAVTPYGVAMTPVVVVARAEPTYTKTV
ncbi:hypothetical protein LEN26_009945 [Aphanomyces euteiches]|nr:hypothetical protein LEN26_009945 [Aphanomyces euteiches]